MQVAESDNLLGDCASRSLRDKDILWSGVLWIFKLIGPCVARQNSLGFYSLRDANHTNDCEIRLQCSTNRSIPLVPQIWADTSPGRASSKCLSAHLPTERQVHSNYSLLMNTLLCKVTHTVPQ